MLAGIWKLDYIPVRTPGLGAQRNLYAATHHHIHTLGYGVVEKTVELGQATIEDDPGDRGTGAHNPLAWRNCSVRLSRSQGKS